MVCQVLLLALRIQQWTEQTLTSFLSQNNLTKDLCFGPKDNLGHSVLHRLAAGKANSLPFLPYLKRLPMLSSASQCTSVGSSVATCTYTREAHQYLPHECASGPCCSQTVKTISKPANSFRALHWLCSRWVAGIHIASWTLKKNWCWQIFFPGNFLWWKFIRSLTT